MKKIKKWLKSLSIRTKLILGFLLTAIIMFVINIMMYGEVNRTLQRVDQIYITNVSLNELSDTLAVLQSDLSDYLNTKSSDVLEDYYRRESAYRDMVEQLNNQTTDNEMRILEKNIRNMSDTYMQTAQDTISAKRGRNVEKYKDGYEEAKSLFQYINTCIYDLNNIKFRTNSNNYQLMLNSMKYMEVVSSVILLLISIINVFLLTTLIHKIVNPLTNLAQKANEVAAGDFDIALTKPSSYDEVGVVTSAFNTMVESIKKYIVQIKESMEKEQTMKEQELLMETHLKDAQLKFLQAQINPHFLFNSLNAGAQLAMMEDAEKTCLFVESMADFFRYNVRKMEEEATLGEELQAVDNYIYILNVRFSGDIHFEKKVDESLLGVKIPSMILQPVVENSINYGIRNIDWEGKIDLCVEKNEKNIIVKISDNGNGMTRARIEEVLSGQAKKQENQADSTGIGLDNVMNRLELYYNKKNLLSIDSEGLGKGTCVTITIPFDEEA